LCLAYSVGRTQETQQRLQRVQLSELDRQLNQLSHVPKLLSEDVEIRRAVASPSEGARLAANKRLARTQRSTGLDFAFLLNPQGLTVASSNWADTVSFVGVSYSFRPYFKQAVRGRGATFFAVGATTGVPGYFIAEPVFDRGQLLGVVVAKIALNVLVQSWSQLPYESLVTDEFGAIILATRDELLYSPTRVLTEDQVAQLEQERRYELQPRRLQKHSKSRDKMQLQQAGGMEVFLLFTQPLEAEPWQLLALVPERELQQKAWVLTAAIVSMALIAYLLFRLYQQQRKLVHAEQRNSQELEEKVLQRTGELEQTQQRLISESNFAMLGRMSAAINHEVNQPLASLRLNLASLRTMIERADADQAEIEQIVVDSDRTTKRIGRVISSLRSLSRKHDLRFEVIDIANLVSEVHSTVKRERQAASHCLTVVLTDRQCLALGDEVLIQQALLNLLYNAFDAVLNIANPRVTMSLKRNCLRSSTTEAVDGGNPRAVEWLIAVSDNGTGVDASAAGNLFEPFETTRGHSDGLGLGLTIARQIALDHGGRLEYRPLSEGSCFTLTIPALSTVPRATDQ